MKSHLSAVHTGLETPYTPALPPPRLPNVNGSFLEEIKKKAGENEGDGATGKQLGRACFIGLSGESSHQTQLKPSLGLIPESFLRFTPDPSAGGTSDFGSGQSTNSPAPEGSFISPPTTKLCFRAFSWLHVCFPNSSKSSKDTDTHVRFLISKDYSLFTLSDNCAQKKETDYIL